MRRATDESSQSRGPYRLILSCKYSLRVYPERVDRPDSQPKLLKNTRNRLIKIVVLACKESRRTRHSHLKVLSFRTITANQELMSVAHWAGIADWFYKLKEIHS